MSLWADLEDRSSGDVIRKEDENKYIKLDKIEEILKSMKVGTKAGEYPPFFAFNMLVEHFDGNIHEYSILAAATQHTDGSKDFYSEPTLNSFKELMDKRGNIIEIDNLFL
jgi:hypothetical protein